MQSKGHSGNPPRMQFTNQIEPLVDQSFRSRNLKIFWSRVCVCVFWGSNSFLPHSVYLNVTHSLMENKHLINGLPSQSWLIGFSCLITQESRRGVDSGTCGTYIAD